MDNVCHTLVGAALAESGLRRRTPLATSALLIGANLPDIDALAYARGSLFALTFRRGWTHGILALAILPLLLTGALLAWERSARRSRAGPRAVPGALLLVSAIAVGTHPVLDLTNTYGVRLLMPFSGHWFYGDTLFIVDPWLWLLLTAGWVMAWRRRARQSEPALAERPARIALGIAMLYVLSMAISGCLARRLVREEALADGVRAATAEMVAPVLANPLRRTVVLKTSTGYRLGEFQWLRSPHVSFSPEPVASGFDSPAGFAGLQSPWGRAFLSWSRFPVAGVRQEGGREVVRLYDLRYAGPNGQSWAAVEIPFAP